MKRYIRQLVVLVVAMIVAVPNAIAQVDLQKSFYVMRNDSTGVTGKLEGGEWLIRFSDTDSLGNQFSNPVAMNIEAAHYADTTYIEMQTVDSVLFEVPEDEMKPGVFELTEDHFKYIIGSDSTTTIRFRIDCLTKIDLPKVGQKVLCNIFRDHLPFGFVGQVESMKASYDLGYIEIICTPIRLSEVYSKLYKAGFSGSDSLNAEAKRRGGFVAPQRRLDPLNRTAMSPGEYADKNRKGWNINGCFIFTTDGDAFFGNNYTIAIGLVNSAQKKEFVRVDTQVEGFWGYEYTAIIDEGEDVERYYIDLPFEITKGSISPVISLQAGSINDEVGGWKKSKKWAIKDKKLKVVDLAVPTPLAGFGLLIDAGVMLDCNAAASAGFKINLGKKSKRIIVEGSGADVDGRLLTVADEKPKLSGSIESKFLLSGSAFIGGYFQLGVGWQSVAEFKGQIAAGILFDAQAAFEQDLSDHTPLNIDVSLNSIKRGKEKCDSIRNVDKISISVGAKLDGVVELLGGNVGVSLAQVFGFDPTAFMYKFYDAKSIPDLSLSNIKSTYDNLHVKLRNETELFLPAKVGALVKEYDTRKKDTKLPLLGESGLTFDLVVDECDVDMSVHPSKRGRGVRIYPYFINTFFGQPISEVFIPGNYEESYIPHKLTIKEIEPDYGPILIEGEIDDDAGAFYNMYNYEDKQTGIIIYDESKNEFARKLNPASEDNRKIECSLDIGLEKGFVATAVYDSYHKKESLSELKPFRFLNKYEPKTLDYENVTTSGATVWAELHEVLVDQIKKGQVTDLEVGFHIQKYTGESSDVWTNAITIPFTDTRYCYQFVDLEPGQGYQYYAAVRKNKDVVYRGETKSFTTLPVIQGLDVTNIGPSRAYLLAEIAKSEDFKTTSVMFQFSEDETFKTTIDVTTEGSDWDFDSETDYYPVSKECDGLAPETEYYYRLAWVRNGEERLRYSEAKTFTTEPPLKNLTHSALGSTRMVIAADIAKIFEDRHFELQLSTNKEDWPYYKYTVEKEESDSPDYNSFTFDIKDLKSQKKYYYRFRCWLGSKEYYSDIMSFTMPKPDLSPTVADVKVTGNSVKITASIPQDLHDKQPEGLYFVVATKKDYSTSDNSTLMVTVPFEKGKLKYEAEFSGLQYDKTYYCTLVAGTIVEEWARADMKSFKTDKNPADTQSCITLDPVVQSDTVTFVGKINDATTLKLFRSVEYPHSAVGFELFKGEGLTNAESDYILFEVDKTTGEFRSEDNRLQPETTYTYRAFVDLTGDKRVCSENSITFKTAKYDGDLVVPDAKKRQDDLEK
jgi:hypothetical protein